MIMVLTLQKSIDSEENLKKRSGLAHHQEIARIMKEEGVLRSPLKYEILERVDGFNR
jgi:hypothetical protein